MLECYTRVNEQPSIPIKPVVSSQYQDWLKKQDGFIQAWVKNSGFTGDTDQISLVPTAEGDVHSILVGVTDLDDFLQFGALPEQLPEGYYHFDETHFENDAQFQQAFLGWGLGAYQFNAYRERAPLRAKLLIPKAINADLLEDWVSTIYLIRDLINTPTQDMGPPELAEAVINVGKEFDAKVNLLVGDELIEAGFSAIHTVGRAGSRPPCLIDLRWGDPNAPKLTLVGKGVCFDTGGLDIKTSDGMFLMKKDMGGAAHALGLARMIMSHELPVCLRLLIPAVENAIGSESYRPGDVIQTRSGVTVEVTNTDAEGRLVLCDAIAEAISEDPDMLMDFATLTGAARVALGADLPALFCNNKELAEGLLASAETVKDPVWQLPLYQPYRVYLNSEIADITNHAMQYRMAGCILAALFLQHFVSDQIPWAHFDLYAWNGEKRPGRPVGGEVFALRGVFHYLQNRFKD